MSATDFEVRHQTLLHLLLVSLAFLTYLLVPDDIVWAFVKDTVHPHLFRDLSFLSRARLFSIFA